MTTPHAETPLYPLKFQPIYKGKVWGGRTLERLGRVLPHGADTLIGESWELADLGQTSVSGGGGEAARSTIAEGPLAGKTLHEVIEAYGKKVLGDLPLTDTGEFPLLCKFLDARQNLSVQVHPSADYAATHDDAFLKSEAWYVLAAEPDAAIYKGVKEGVTPEQFRRAIEENTVEPLLIKVPVKVGDCHYLPSGTCHALGAGVLAAEVQTPSDTTYRVYDWGRAGRELHIEQAMQCIKFGPADVSQNEPHTRVQNDQTTLDHLVVTEFFRIDRITAPSSYEQELVYEQPVVWMVLSGGGEITCDGGPAVAIHQGETLYLPPAMTGGRLKLDAETTWLEVTFPQAESKQIA